MATRRKTVATNVAAVPPVLGGVASSPVSPMRSVPSPKAGRTVKVGADGRAVDRRAEASVLRAIAARFRTHFYKDTVGWMHDTLNPLWNVSSRQAQMIYDFARSGNYAQLEYLYNEIENCSPVFSVCVTRRTGALSELDWKVVRSDERLNRNADAGLVKEQKEFLETAIAHIDNLPEALEHFALSSFRGFSVASVWRGSDGMPSHLECLDHWNVCRDLRNNKWLWNPGAVSFVNPTFSSSGMTEIPAEDSVALVRKRQIDWPAMKIFLREAIGERDWGRFLETYGLPPVIITMPEFTSKEDQDAYVEAAASVFEGRSGVIPNGSEVNFASESRGVNPFTEFVDHQMKLFVLLSTGGTLTSLSEATGIGSGASETQMDTWKQIVRADVRMVSNAINRQLCQRLISEHKDFKGKPILVEFSLDTEPRLTAKEAVELASSLSSAGYEMDVAELSQLTGFTLRKKQDGGGMGFNAETNPPPKEEPETVANVDGGGDTSLVADPGVTVQAGQKVVRKAENASPASIVGRLAKLESKQPGASRQYWDGLSIADRDAALLHLIRQLPKGRQYTKDQVMDFIDGKVGRLAALTFSVRWEQLFNTLSDREGGRFHAATTHGLQTIDVLNTETGAEPPKTPSAASAPQGGASIPPANGTPQNAGIAPLAEEVAEAGIGQPPNETRPAPSLAAAEKADAVTPQAEKIGERIVKSLQTDFKEVADELAKVLAKPEGERAGAAAELLARLDSLIPDDPAMAEVIEEQMREAFRIQLERQPEGDAPAANKAIPNSKKG